MSMQIATIKKINTFKALMGAQELRYEEIMNIIESHSKEVPSWTTLRKYGVLDIVRVEGYTIEAEDSGDALLWNGWYQWDEKKKIWVIDHFFKIYKVV